VAPLSDKDICRLDVPVNDSFGMSGFESVSDLDGDFEDLLCLEGFAGDAVL